MFTRRAILFCFFPWASNADETFVTVTEKSLREAATYKAEPEYPAVARQLRVTGDVDLLVSVDTAGAVERATVVSGNTLLAGASVNAIRRWRFTPFRSAGQPARASGPVRFTFQI